MRNNFEPALKTRVLVFEGGKVDDPRDPGGRTNQGVTQATYNAWRKSRGLAISDVYAMADAERDDIYLHGYWIPCAGDELPSGLDLAVFDAAVNSGVGMAARWLQTTLNIPSDGVIGPATKSAIYNLAAEHDESSIIRRYCSLRMGSLERLSTWKTFGAGWSARVASVQATALAWDEQPWIPNTQPPAPSVSKATVAANPAPSAQQAKPNAATTASAVKQTDAEYARLKQGNMKAPISSERLAQTAVHPVVAQTASVVAALAGGATQLSQSLAPASGAITIFGHCFFAGATCLGVIALYLGVQHKASTDAALGRREGFVETREP